MSGGYQPQARGFGARGEPPHEGSSGQPPASQRIADVQKLIGLHPTPWRAEDDGGWVRLFDAKGGQVDCYLAKNRDKAVGIAAAVNLAAAVRA